MKKICLFIILIFACGDIDEQIIGYKEIVQSAWEFFSDEEYEQARTEFTNALDYDVLNNIAEAYIGIGWCNLYIANQFTNLNDSETRNDLRDIASNYFTLAQTKDTEAEATDKISYELKAIMLAGLVFVYDYKLLKFNDLYYNNSGEYNEYCYHNNIPDEFRSNCIIPVVKEIVSESNRLIEYQENFEFSYDSSINIDDIRFIRARLAFSFENFYADEFHISEADEEIDYPIHELEICMIIELTDECIELGLDVSCDEEYYPNIPVEDFLGCLSSFYTP